jgi:ankyrin repeat protein
MPNVSDKMVDYAFKAILNNYVYILGELIRIKPELLDTIPRIGGQTTLLIFSADHYLNCSPSFRKLISLGANVNATDIDGRTALIALFSSFNDRSKSSKNIKGDINLLLQKGVDLNAVDNQGKTALTYAIESLPRSFDSTVLLLEKGADPRLLYPDGRSSLAHLLEGSGLKDKDLTDLIKIFLSKGADQYHSSVIRRYPSYEANSIRDGIYRECLESYVVTVDLDHAIRKGYTEDIKSLIDKYPNSLNRQQRWSLGGGYTISPLMLAAFHGKADSLNTLLDLGADIDAKDKNGYTALRHAIEENYEIFPTISHLLGRGADVNIECKSGAISLACVSSIGIYDEDFLRLVNELIKFGSNLDHPSVIKHFINIDFEDISETFIESRRLVCNARVEYLSRKIFPLTDVNIGEHDILVNGAIALPIDLCIAFADALKVDKKLTNINLCYHGIKEDGVHAFANALRENKTLTNINLEGNNIGEAGADHLVDALCNNNTLTNINLAGNNIGEVGANYFVNALRENNTLTNIGALKIQLRQIHAFSIFYWR